MAKKGCVYFIQADGLDLIKIGWTGGNPDERFRRLQATNAATLIPLGLMQGGRGIERGLHARFTALHDHGEWFQSDPALLAFIADETIAWKIPGLAFRRRAVAPPTKQTTAEWAAVTTITYRGETRTVAQWADLKQVSIWCIKSRMERGRDPDRIFMFAPKYVPPAARKPVRRRRARTT